MQFQLIVKELNLIQIIHSMFSNVKPFFYVRDLKNYNTPVLRFNVSQLSWQEKPPDFN